MNVRAVAKLLGVSHWTCYLMVKRGDIPAIRCGPKRVVIPRAAVERLLGAPLTDEILERAAARN